MLKVVVRHDFNPSESTERISKCSTVRPPVEVRFDGNQIFRGRFDGKIFFFFSGRGMAKK